MNIFYSIFTNSGQLKSSFWTLLNAQGGKAEVKTLETVIMVSGKDIKTAREELVTTKHQWCASKPKHIYIFQIC